ncbi:carbohydrate esterase family 15 protein, partial [Amniculicola lignicola CBS 123094]
TTSQSKLPDPFTFFSGQRVVSKADWTCRRAELAATILEWELGPLPPKPSTVNATFSDNKLTINIFENGRQTSFTAKVKLPPSTFKAPYPAIIAYGAASIPVPEGIAIITFSNDEMAQQTSSTRGRGKFYDIYGAPHPAGAFIAWTWGVSRIIDALEFLGPSITSIDPSHIALTGCSRNGKGVLVAGAYEERIALTIPQEAGIGGTACLRLYAEFTGCQGRICIPEVPTPPWLENTWCRKDFDAVVRRGLQYLPFDHHELMALIAPRGLLVIENDIDWNMPVPSTVCSKAGRMVYDALGIKEAFGFSLVGGHSHCSFPAAQKEEVDAFMDKYLLGKGES